MSFSITGLMFPYGIPIYSPSVGLLFIYTLMTNKKLILFDKYLIVFYLLEVIYLASLLHTNTIYINVKLDIINMITINMIFIILINNLKNPSDFTQFYYFFKLIVLISTSIIGIIALYKYILLSNGYSLMNNNMCPWGTSLVIDYNLFTLGFIAAILFSYDIFKKNKKIYLKILIVILSSFFISIALLSGSRRGIVIILLLSAIFLSIKYIRNNNFIKNNKIYLFTSLSTFAVVFLLVNTNLNFIINNNELNNPQHELNKILNIAKTMNKYSSIEARVIRWEYAKHLFISYDIKEKLFGSGFNYLNKYSEKFNNNKGEDYPHNIFISHLLFSGIIGIVILLLLYYKVTRLYMQYPELKRFFILFIITTTYLLISANSLFSFKLYLLLIIIPFIYHIIQLNTKIKISVNCN